MRSLYIDIDGVLIGKNKSIPDGVEEFLKFATTNYECFWLTTHCKGNSATAIKYLSELYSADYLTFWELIKATDWDVLKTEAIDYSREFYWLDDQPLQSEKISLSNNKSLGNLIIVNLNRPNELSRIMRTLA